MLQREERRRAAQTRFAELRRRVRAATRLQHFFRSKRTEREYIRQKVRGIVGSAVWSSALNCAAPNRHFTSRRVFAFALVLNLTDTVLGPRQVMNQGATQLQRVVRGRQARRRVRKQRSEDDAATRIQCRVRIRQSHKRVEGVKGERQQQTFVSARTIQNNYRSRRCVGSVVPGSAV